MDKQFTVQITRQTRDQLGYLIHYRKLDGHPLHTLKGVLAELIRDAYLKELKNNASK